MIASAERIAVENKGFGGLGTKNGSYWKVPKDLVSRSGGLAFQNLRFGKRFKEMPARVKVMSQRRRIFSCPECGNLYEAYPPDDIHTRHACI